MKLNFLLAGVFCVGLGAASSPAFAQVSSTEQAVSLNAALVESLTVSLSANSVNFTLTVGSATNAGSATITATTSWVLDPTRTAVQLYGYFSSATAALTHTAPMNTVDIPSSAVEVSVNGAANTAFTQTVAFGAASAGRQIFSQAITALNLVGTRSDTLALNINLSNLQQLPADTYTGTLRIRAQATP
jgi:hypothetical protein